MISLPEPGYSCNPFCRKNAPFTGLFALPNVRIVIALPRNCPSPLAFATLSSRFGPPSRTPALNSGPPVVHVAPSVSTPSPACAATLPPTGMVTPLRFFT